MHRALYLTTETARPSPPSPPGLGDKLGVCAPGPASFRFFRKARAPRRPRSAVSAPGARRCSAVSGRSAWCSAQVRGRCGAGISPQLGSRPRPPGPRPCRPSNAWWSATGECAARSCGPGRRRPGRPWLGWAHGSGARPARRAARVAQEGAVGRGPGWPAGRWARPPAQAHLMLPGTPPGRRLASQWVGPTLLPGQNPQLVPPSLPCHPPGGTVAGTLPGALRRLAPPSPRPPLRCREARPPWSSSPSPRLLRDCCAGTPVPTPGTLSWPVAPWEGALLAGQRG